jgi:hypothetical protein
MSQPHPDRGLIPHGIRVLEIDRDQVVGIDAFIDPSLLPPFGLIADTPPGRSP